MIEARRTLRFSPETDTQLEALAKVMHAGNMTATISELIRAEVGRRNTNGADSVHGNNLVIDFVREVSLSIYLREGDSPLFKALTDSADGFIPMSEITSRVATINKEHAKEFQLRAAIIEMNSK